MYKPNYCTQVLHEATTANLDYVLFIVADEDGVAYSVLIHSPSHKRRVYLGILESIYDRTLSWYPQLRGTLMIPCQMCLLFVSRSPSYPVDKKSLLHFLLVEDSKGDEELNCLAPLPTKCAYMHSSCHNKIDLHSRNRTSDRWMFVLLQSIALPTELSGD